MRVRRHSIKSRFSQGHRNVNMCVVRLMCTLSCTFLCLVREPRGDEDTKDGIMSVPLLREKSIPRLPRNERCNFFSKTVLYLFGCLFWKAHRVFLKKKKQKEVLPNLKNLQLVQIDKIVKIYVYIYRVSANSLADRKVFEWLISPRCDVMITILRYRNFIYRLKNPYRTINCASK